MFLCVCVCALLHAYICVCMCQLFVLNLVNLTKVKRKQETRKPIKKHNLNYRMHKQNGQAAYMLAIEQFTPPILILLVS